ncbi:MAG: asparagine synthetase B, partial [candidate division Zixibacteria bacterium]|nr:asparagine synthetase B [candidate division Zixibacteria bacterium]
MTIRTVTFYLFFVLAFASSSQAASLYIPMNKSQTDHLKAYGVVFKALEMGKKAQWLLNYEGGSFLIDYSPAVANLCLLMGVTSEKITSGQEA